MTSGLNVQRSFAIRKERYKKMETRTVDCESRGTP